MANRHVHDEQSADDEQRRRDDAEHERHELRPCEQRRYSLPCVPRCQSQLAIGHRFARERHSLDAATDARVYIHLTALLMTSLTRSAFLRLVHAPQHLALLGRPHVDGFGEGGVLERREVVLEGAVAAESTQRRVVNA